MIASAAATQRTCTDHPHPRPYRRPRPWLALTTAACLLLQALQPPGLRPAQYYYGAVAHQHAGLLLPIRSPGPPDTARPAHPTRMR